MTDDQINEAEQYGERPEVTTTDTQVVRGADGPPSDEEPPSPPEHVLAERRARYLAAHDDRPAALALDDAVEIPRPEEGPDVPGMLKAFGGFSGQLPPYDGFTITLRQGERTIDFSDQWDQDSTQPADMLVAFRRAAVQAEERIEELWP
jgi:hypothetical protein